MLRRVWSELFKRFCYSYRLTTYTLPAFRVDIVVLGCDVNVSHKLSAPSSSAPSSTVCNLSHSGYLGCRQATRYSGHGEVYLDTGD